MGGEWGGVGMKLTIGVMGASGGDLNEPVRRKGYELGGAIEHRGKYGSPVEGFDVGLFAGDHVATASDHSFPDLCGGLAPSSFGVTCSALLRSGRCTGPRSPVPMSESFHGSGRDLQALMGHCATAPRRAAAGAGRS